MDAKTFTSLQINRLQDLLSEEVITNNIPGFVQDVVTAIKDIHTFEQKLPNSADLQTAYVAEDVTDSLFIRKECHPTRNTSPRRKESQPSRNRENINGFKKKFQRPFRYFKPSHSQDKFALELEKFRTEITALSTREDVFGSKNDAVSLEEETHVLELERLAALLGIDNRDHSNGEQVPKQDNNHSTTQVTAAAGGEIQEEAPQQDNNRSTDQVTAVNAALGEGDSGRATENHSDHLPLVPHSNDNSTTQVIAVVGKADSGTSTLARTVYDHVDVNRHFTKRAWIRVSCESNPGEDWLDILKQSEKGVPEEETPSEVELSEETLSDEELRSEPKQGLKDINYLVVIEDVETPEVWKAVRDAVNDSSCHRGKIVITSRNPDAALQADSTLRISIPPLSDDESWKLFLKKVQLAENQEVTSKHKENILKVCGGLPLRIVWLGSLLSTKDWSSVNEINENRGAILALLSYQDLPSQVKSCFLYMGLFPKGYDIPVRRLIHLWCAEGFLTPNSKEMFPEDLAELYILLLVIGNMILVERRFDGSPKTCRMHDSLHDFYSRQATDVGFFYHDQLQQSHAYVKPLVQRLAAPYMNTNFPLSPIDLRNLRSCVVFDTRVVQETPASQIDGLLDKIIDNRDFGLLKVLDLEGLYKPTLTDAAVEKLLQLRYLGLRSTSIDSLPNFVGFLPYLETLDLKHTNIQNFPTSMRKAKKLQHFYLNGSHFEIVMNLSSSNLLYNLRTLWGLCVKDNSNGKLNFSRLRKLGLTCHSTSALKMITQLTQLQYLKVKYVEEGRGQSNGTSPSRQPQWTQLQESTAPQTIQQQWTQLQESAARLRQQSIRGQSTEETSGTLQFNLQGMEKLQNLYWMGKLEKQVIDVRFLPPNLKILTLSGSRLEEDPMPVLEKLCYLKILRLFPDSYIGREMKCSLEGFPQLHVLKLWKLEQLNSWTVENGAMPCTQELEIRECNQMQLPTGLQHLTTLKELVLTNMEDFHEVDARSLVGTNVNIKIN